MKFRSLLIFLSILFIVNAYNKSNKKVQLKFSPEPGCNYIYKITEKKDIINKIGTNTIKTKDSEETYITVKVLGIDSSECLQFEVNFDSLFFYGETPAGEIVYNSNNPTDESNPAAMANTQIGEKFIYKVKPNGKVVDVIGYEKIFEKQRKTIKNLGVETVSDEMLKALNEQRKESLLYIFKMYFREMPVDSVIVGYKWNLETKPIKPFPMNIKEQYKFVELKDSITIFKVKGAILPNPEPGMIGLTKIQYLTRGRLEGTLENNIFTGMPYKIMIKQDFEVSSDMPMSSNIQSSVSITQEIKSLFQMELLKRYNSKE